MVFGGGRATHGPALVRLGGAVIRKTFFQTSFSLMLFSLHNYGALERVDGIVSWHRAFIN